MGRNLFRGSECFQSGKRQQLFLLRQSAQKRLAQLFRDRQNDGRQRREPLDMYRRRRTQLPGYPVGKVHALHAQRRRPAKHWKQQPEIHLFPSGNRNALYRHPFGRPVRAERPHETGTYLAAYKRRPAFSAKQHCKSDTALSEGTACPDSRRAGVHEPGKRTIFRCQPEPRGQKSAQTPVCIRNVLARQAQPLVAGTVERRSRLRRPYHVAHIPIPVGSSLAGRNHPYI